MGFENLSPDAKMRYRKMIEQHNADEANKKKNIETREKKK